MKLKASAKRNEAQSLFIFPAETPSNASAPAANANTAGSETVYDNRPTWQCLERSHQSQFTYYCVYIYSTSTKNIVVWLHTRCFAQAPQYRPWAEIKSNNHTSKVNVTLTSQTNTPSLRNFDETLNKKMTDHPNHHLSAMAKKKRTHKETSFQVHKCSRHALKKTNLRRLNAETKNGFGHKYSVNRPLVSKN